MSSNDVQTLQAAYDAFAKQDIPAVMATFQDDIEWELPDSIPFGGKFTGHDGVGDFFGQLGQYWQELAVEPQEFIDGGERIVALVRVSGTASGGSVDSPSVHVWTMRDGKAAAFREYPDTAAVLKAVGE